MRRVRGVALLILLAAVGCGGGVPALPTSDEAAEKEDAECIQRAGAAERKCKPAGEED